MNLLLVCAWPQVQNLLSASWTNNPLFRRSGRKMRECSMSTRNTILGSTPFKKSARQNHWHLTSRWSLSNGTVPNLTLLTLTVQEMISFNHIPVLEARILNWNKWWCTLFHNSSLFFPQIDAAVVLFGHFLDKVFLTVKKKELTTKQRLKCNPVRFLFIQWMDMQHFRWVGDFWIQMPTLSNQWNGKIEW